MSYQVLARKWRPGNFDELVGQQQTAQALINALDNNRLHHAYLFTGTRGVGKTTIARILSKSLNCENGITSKPCGKCSSCTEISQGNFVDLLEIDAASKTKVEDTRELLDNVQYRPTRGRYKVYLIDEVHMLSGHSFNALLKTLEEPPPHVVFLLATTDPQKLPVTVLSRCLQFHLRRMEEEEISNHLAMILGEEKFGFEKEALSLIAKGADGSMRDGLSLLDQAIAYCNDDITQSKVADMLGSIDKSYAFELLDAIKSNDANLLIQCIDKIAEYAPDYDELLADWLSLLHQIAVNQATGVEKDPQVAQQAKAINPADLQLFYQLSLHARRDLAYASHPRQGFEMAMLRIMAFKPQTSPKTDKQTSSLNKKKVEQTVMPVVAESSVNSQTVSESSYQVSAGSRFNNSNSSNITAQRSVQEPLVAISQNIIETQAKQAAVKADLKVVVNNDTKVNNKTLPEADEKKSLNQAQIINEVSQNHTLEKPQLLPEKLQLSEISANNWFQVIAGIGLKGNGQQVLMNAIACFENNQLAINHLEKVTPLLTENIKNSVIERLRVYFQQDDLTIQFNSVNTLEETPMQRKTRLHNIAIDEAHEKLLNDPQISYLVNTLGASISRDSINIKD